MKSIAIIGAGVAGTVCAHRLKQADFNPIIFEKSRGLGGRLATRRTRAGHTFDHGAQYITAHSAKFKNFVEHAVSNGVADVWAARQNIETDDTKQSWYVGKPSMNAFLKPLTENLDIRFNTEVVRIDRNEGGWRVITSQNQESSEFGVIISTAPAPQTARLANKAPEIVTQLKTVAMAPCWAVVIAFDERFDPGFDVARPISGDIAWIARNNTKPGREGSHDCWVIHTSPEWSIRNLEADKTTIIEKAPHLLAEACSSPLPRLSYIDVHRWRYALTTAPVGKPFIHDASMSFFATGDWCLGARVECAYESGLALAETLISQK